METIVKRITKNIFTEANIPENQNTENVSISISIYSPRILEAAFFKSTFQNAPTAMSIQEIL